MCKDLIESFGEVSKKQALLHGEEKTCQATVGAVALFTGVMLSNLTKGSKATKVEKERLFKGFDSLYREVERSHGKQLKGSAIPPKPLLN